MYVQIIKRLYNYIAIIAYKCNDLYVRVNEVLHVGIRGSGLGGWVYRVGGGLVGVSGEFI